LNIENLIPLIDSRKLITPENTLFFAIKSSKNDGHKYIADLYAKGVRNFIIEDPHFDTTSFIDVNFIKVESSVAELQKIAQTHRLKYSIPVVGITGSNGKTIVKEWLSQLLEESFNIVKTPRSYNSQLGVPLSILEIKNHHTLAVFEAGISQVGEMQKLQKIIKPTIGVFTTIGSAHNEGFENKEEKIEEKLTLFNNVELLVLNKDQTQVYSLAQKKGIKILSWSLTQKADIEFRYDGGNLSVKSQIYNVKSIVNFKNKKQADVENICNCIAVGLILRIPISEIENRVKRLKPINMRLELKKGKNNCYIIDDTYNNDFVGLKTALELFNSNYQTAKRTVILSDIFQSGLPKEQLYVEVNLLLKSNSVTKFIGIGKDIISQKHLFEVESQFYKTTEQFLLSDPKFDSETILVKGARDFHFEEIVIHLTEKQHRAYLDVNLNALANNLNIYQSKLSPETKLMVMVKAFAYGAGSNEVANFLQFNNVDYLAVAYADEGVELRKNGVKLPIMVMNPDPFDFINLVNYNLEAEIYAFDLLDSWINFVNGKTESPSIHLKIDTGMHRLGFEEEDLKKLISVINTSKLKVASIFSHLASADNTLDEKFNRQQIEDFKTFSNVIEKGINQKTIKHILNSAGIINYNQAQLDMVRLGLGLYGVDPANSLNLDTVISLYAQISQIKLVKKGDSIGYGRVGEATENIKIATINIGYADGVSRQLSNGKGSVFINGKIVKIVGNVCMDMLMVDVTSVECATGDKVEILGSTIKVEDVAKQSNTISYEILSSISERVKRIYFQK